MEKKYISAELKYEKMNTGMTYEEGDKYIREGMANASRNPMNMVRFSYKDEEQKKKIYDAIQLCIRSYGGGSPRSQNGQSIINPYFVNENGEATSRVTGIIGGVGLPNDLVTPFIKRFVELDLCRIKMGDMEFIDECPKNLSKLLTDFRAREEQR